MESMNVFKALINYRYNTKWAEGREVKETEKKGKKERGEKTERKVQYKTQGEERENGDKRE